jgi:hypothetical protein
VTLDNDTFTRPSCATTTPGGSTGTTPGGGTGTTPGGGTGTTPGGAPEPPPAAVVPASRASLAHLGAEPRCPRGRWLRPGAVSRCCSS